MKPETRSNVTQELLILIGIPASGKSTYANALEYTHVIISKDKLGQRAGKQDRQMKILAEELYEGSNVIIDNCNATAAVRAPLIAEGLKFGVCTIAVYFEPDLKISVERNMQRPEKNRVPEFVLRNMFCSIEPPTVREGFDRIRYVS